MKSVEADKSPSFLRHDGLIENLIFLTCLEGGEGAVELSFGGGRKRKGEEKVIYPVRRLFRKHLGYILEFWNNFNISFVLFFCLATLEKTKKNGNKKF